MVSDHIQIPLPIAEQCKLRDVIIKSNGSGIALEQYMVDQYINQISLNGSEKVNNKKLAAMWMYATHMGIFPPSQQTLRKSTSPSRSIMLIPATAAGNGLQMPPPPPARMPPAPPCLGGSMVLPVPPQYRGMTLPLMRTGSVLYAHPISLTATYHTKSAELNGQRRRHRAAEKLDKNRRQRCKSEADVLDGGSNFKYTGLDRAIADSFLERQEQSQTSSHIDYPS